MTPLFCPGFLSLFHLANSKGENPDIHELFVHICIAGLTQACIFTIKLPCGDSRQTGHPKPQKR